jgi:outer membrane autotransporter protein
LVLRDSTVSATGPGARGLEMFEGTTTAIGSTISGQQYGARLRGDSTVQLTNQLTLDSTRVEGVTGPAIIVGTGASDPSTATIDVNNGSTLVGGNGNVLQVIGNSTATLNVDNSQLVGDVTAEAGSTANLTLKNRATLTGRLENVASLALNSQGQWNMVGDGQVENLSMDGGAVKFGDAASFYTLSVANLSGSGTFMMDVDFGQAQTDFLNITGSATGSHSLLIGSTGTDPLADTSLHVVHAAAGDANFSLAGGAVDLGTWSYDLIKQGDNDWYLDSTTRTVSPGTRTVLALFNTAPTVWYGELSTLRSRMGELRINGGRSGGWMRTYGNKFNVADASGFGYQQVQQGVSLGADGRLPVGDGQWLAGVMAGQSKSDLDLDRGTSGKVDSYYVGAYSTWLDSETGYYVDGVLKFNRFKNKAKVNLSDGTRTKGDYDNSGVGASLEFGRHIKLDDNYFVEPYTQIAGVIIEGKDYDLDNGMRAEGDRTRSLLGKVGVTAGRNFDLGQGRTVQPYVRTAVAHEFAKNNEVQVNNNVFNNDLSGSRGELGAGVAVALSDTFEVHADFEYSNGDKIEQPWGANIGLRYNW